MPTELNPAEHPGGTETFDPWGNLARLIEDCLRVDRVCIERGTLDLEDPREQEMHEELLDVLHEARSKTRTPRLDWRRKVPLRVPTLARASARAPRRRSVRTSRAKARSPGSSSSDSESEPPPPPLDVIPLAAFRRQLEEAGL